MCSEEDSYACPVCGLWVGKSSGHEHFQQLYASCEHDYIPYPLDYMSSGNCGQKMMCRKCLKVDYLQG